MRHSSRMSPQLGERYWALAPDELLAEFGSSRGGLSSAEAAERLDRFGSNELVSLRRTPAWRLLLAQFESPLVLILVSAAIVSAVLSDWKDAVVVGVILLISAGLGFWRENAAKEIVPGDGVLLAAEDLFVSQAVLTGETFPVARRPGVSRPDAPIGERENAVFFGTSVRSRSFCFVRRKPSSTAGFGSSGTCSRRGCSR